MSCQGFKTTALTREAAAPAGRPESIHPWSKGRRAGTVLTVDSSGDRSGAGRHCPPPLSAGTEAGAEALTSAVSRHMRPPGTGISQQVMLGKA